MIPIQSSKLVAAIPPAAVVKNASATATAIDTRGYDYLTVAVTLGATDVALTALKLQNCSTSGGTYADVTGANFDGGSGFAGATLALPTSSDGNKVYTFHVDCRNKNPFYKVVATAANGTTGAYISAVAVLSRGKIPPSTSTGVSDGGCCLVV
jgi:hypothetical protein